MFWAVIIYKAGKTNCTRNLEEEHLLNIEPNQQIG